MPPRTRSASLAHFCFKRRGIDGVDSLADLLRYSCIFSSGRPKMGCAFVLCNRCACATAYAGPRSHRLSFQMSNVLRQNLASRAEIICTPCPALGFAPCAAAAYTVISRQDLQLDVQEARPAQVGGALHGVPFAHKLLKFDTVEPKTAVLSLFFTYFSPCHLTPSERSLA